jgi:tetratricopeptide (TPR) repeat protein
MALTDLVAPQSVIASLKVSNKKQALQELAARASDITGRPEREIFDVLMQRAMRLDPRPPSSYYGALGDSLLFAKRVEEAIPAHRQCVELTPDLIWCRLGLTVDYALVEKTDQAAAQAKEALRINPKITAADNTYVRSIADPAQRASTVAALRRAGLK